MNTNDFITIDADIQINHQPVASHIFKNIYLINSLFRFTSVFKNTDLNKMKIYKNGEQSLMFFDEQGILYTLSKKKFAKALEMRNKYNQVVFNFEQAEVTSYETKVMRRLLE